MNSNLAFLFLEELGNTLIMTFASSALAYVIGIPLGILLVVWAKNGIRPNPRAQEALGVIINLIRSVPFLILVIAIQNFTRMEAARIRMDTIPVVMGSGERIFWMLVFASSAPMSRIITLTARPERYSVRPCP